MWLSCGNWLLKRGVSNVIASVGTWLAVHWALNRGARSIQVALYRVCMAIILDPECSGAEIFFCWRCIFRAKICAGAGQNVSKYMYVY